MEKTEMMNRLFPTALCIERKPTKAPTEGGPDIISFPALCFFTDNCKNKQLLNWSLITTMSACLSHCTEDQTNTVPFH